METVDITNERGETRKYETVASRVQRFRAPESEHRLWGIQTEIVSIDNDSVVVRCGIGYWSEAGNFLVIATGHAEEWRGSSEINVTSALENAETSAIGRALAALGYGLSDSYASANEVQRAMAKRHAIDNARPGALILLQQAAKKGRAALQDVWENQLSKPDRQACKNDMPALKAEAARVDSDWHNQGNEDGQEG